MENTTTRTANGVTYYQDWEQEGHIVIINPQTTALYHQLKYEQQPPAGDYFYAFSQEQFDRAVKDKHLEDAVIVHPSGCPGLYGTSKAIADLEAYYVSVAERIKNECNPQEVYLYECNNHEYMYNWDGDEEALLVIIRYWGEDVARTVHRVRANYSIEEIVERDNR